MRAAFPARAPGLRFPSPARLCARRGPAPARGAFHGSGAPGSGQLIVELATKGDVAGLRDLLDSSYGGGVGASSELDASTRAIVGAQVRTAAQRAAQCSRSCGAGRGDAGAAPVQPPRSRIAALVVSTSVGSVGPAGPVCPA